MVELRKRPAPAAPAPAPKKRAPSKAKVKPVKGEASKAEAEPEEAAPAAPEETLVEPAVEAPKGGAPKVGDSITLEGFGGEIQTNDEEKITLAKLVADSKAGVVLFTYPKASTPGCENALDIWLDTRN